MGAPIRDRKAVPAKRDRSISGISKKLFRTWYFVVLQLQYFEIVSVNYLFKHPIIVLNSTSIQ